MDYERRSEVPLKYRWNVDDIFESTEQWRDSYETAENLIADLESRNERFVENAEALLRFLRLRDELLATVDSIGAYATRRRDLDIHDDEARQLVSRANSLKSRAAAEVSSFEADVRKLDTVEFENRCSDEPELQTYEHYVEDILRREEHVLEDELESTLSQLEEITNFPQEFYNTLRNSDLSFPSVEDSDGGEIDVTIDSFTRHQRHPNREVRRRTYDAFYDEWRGFEHAITEAYAKSLRNNVKRAEIRGYDSVLEASLDETNVPVDVYEQLLDVVKDNVEPLHRHLSLKTEEREIEELRPWDIYLPTATVDSPEIPFPEAKDIVLAACEPLGEGYQEILTTAFDSRWVDAYEAPSKRSGAYTGWTYNTHPFVLLNYQNDVDSVYTLAHEMGHALHSVLSTREQPYVYTDYDVFTAEVASMVNETLVTYHLLRETDDVELRKYVLSEFLERFRTVLYRQALLAEFEYVAHDIAESEKEITTRRLNAEFLGLKEEFYEPVRLDERIKYEWMRIRHLYNPFYVYQYAIGLCAAVSIASDVTSQGETARERYLSFLRRGGRGYPLELLQLAGVDLTSANAMADAFELYRSCLAELESLIAQ